ncbi:hypothetical protein K6T82_19115 [Flavobacterium sp. 17A]|uniref:Uncharacterized protein n=1 Tax=Flavobacterium potami TaxID=2872310 RepID=A0A9X1HE94_9FLAO|nr:hypothetical protein [Flavobacterium potami]MBZ4036889.1 hypothetical protein [Flavobacterium potami]
MDIMNHYGNNYNKPEYSFDYVDKKLNPTLTKVQTIICKTEDKELLESFLIMIQKSSGSANEHPADILGGIFICHPEIVEEELKGKFKDKMIFDNLELGFLNITTNLPLDNKLKNLKNRMYKLINTL